MRKLAAFAVFAALALVPCARAQNFSTVTASHLSDASGNPVASGTICFLGTDLNDNPIAFRPGGGGQAIIQEVCAPISAGAIVGTFQVANPANTSPANIAYRVTVTSQTPRGNLRYNLVQFTGSPFNFDDYVPTSPPIPLGQTVSVLSVDQLTITGSCVGCGGAGSSIFAQWQFGSNTAITSNGNYIQFAAPAPFSLTQSGAGTSLSPYIDTLSFSSQAQNSVLAGPCSGGSGAPAFRALCVADLPAPGTNGQLLFNNNGVVAAEDPIVSGATAIGAAPSTNPVFVGTWDSSGNIRVPQTSNGTPGGSDYALEVRNIPSGTQTISGSISLTGSWPYSGALGTVSLTGSLPAFASTPAFTISGTLPAFASTPTVNAAESGTWTVQQGGAPWSVSGSGSFTVVQGTGTNLHVVCDSGCSSSSGFTDNSAFTVGTTAIVNLGAYYTSGAAPSISSGNAGRVRMDANSYLYTDCAVGCSGGATTPSDAFANPTTAGLSFSFLAGFNGTTWDRLRDDSNKYLYVDVSNSTLAATQSGTWTVQQGGAPWSVSQSGNWTTRIVGNAGAILDAAQNAAAPANELVAGAVYNSTLPSLTNGNATQLQAGPNGGLIVDLYSYNGSSWGPASPWPSDNSAFTAGTTAAGVIAGWYASSPTACTSGDLCAPSLTSDRKLFVQSFQGTSPWIDSVTMWGGGTLGAMANYGTSPGGVLVPGVNAYITNTPAVTGSGNFTVTQATGTNLHMVCDSGCSSSAGFADNSAFTVGTTAINVLGGLYDTGADPSISNGDAGRARIDSHSYLFSDITALAGTVLGAPSNYGTSPGAVEVLGVNAYITNTPAVTGSGNFTVVQSTGTNLHMVCDSGCSSSAGFADNSAFTVGTTAINVLGGLYDSGADPSISNGNAGRARIDSHSYLFSDITALAGTVLGAPSNYGTSPGAVEVPGVNAYVTNTVAVSGTFWQSTQPVSIAANVGVTQQTSPWIVAGGGTAGSPGTAVLTIQGVGSGTAVPVSGTFWQSTQPVSLASLPALVAGSAIVGKVGIDQTTPGTTNAVFATNFPTTVDTNTGNASASTIREAVATNNPAIAAWGQGATGSAVPSGAVYLGGNAGGNLTGQEICPNTYVNNGLATSGSTQAVALSSGKSIYICDFFVNSSSTTAVNVKLVYGTGTNCATSPSDLSILVPMQAPTSVAPAGQNVTPPGNILWSTPVSQAVCVNLSSANAVNVMFHWDQR